MSKSSYLTANVSVTSDSFGGWIGKTNLVIYDMATVVVTVGDVVQPNNSNGAETTGNAHIEGIFSTSTLVAGTTLRGGTVSVPATIDVSSNANFTSTNGTINVTSSINTFNIDANNSIISSNVVFDGGITKKILIDVANTTVNTGSLYVNSNTYLNGVNTYITSTELKSTSNTILAGSRLDIDGTIVDVTSNTVFTSATLNANVVSTTIGNVGTNTLTVNSQADFNANVNIDGILTQTANAVFTGGAINASSNTTLTGSRLDIDGTIVDVTSNTVFTSGTLNANVVAVTIGNIGTNTLVVNSQADFNANVNIDGILTQTANAVFTGSLVNITGANTTVGDLGTDKLNVNATSDFNANVNIDGILTQTANASFTGGQITASSNTTLTGSRLDIDGTIVDVTSNTVFTSGTLNANVVAVTIGSAGTNTLVVNSQADFNANVNIDGLLTQTANATFTGSLVNITGANTTVGDLGTDKLNVNATSDFNANVNIDGVFTVTNSSSFTGSLVNITSANTTVGDLGTDKLNVNAASDFNANVNIDGLLTQTANATFSGAETYFDNNVTLGASVADTVSILGYVDADVLPSATTVDLGSDAKPFGNVHTTFVYADTDVEAAGQMVLKGAGAKTLRVLSADALYPSLNVLLSTSANANTLVMVANTSGIHAGANTLYDLGSVATNWNKLHVKDAAVANSAVVSNVLTVNSQANTASLMVRDLTATRVVYAGTGGELVDSANLTFSGTTLAVTQANTGSLMVQDLTVNRVVYAGTGGELVDSANLTFNSSTLAVTGNTTISANLSVTNVVSAANVVVSSHVGTATLGTSGLATLNSMNVVNTATFNANVDLQDSDYLKIGTGDDLQIFHDGLNSYIRDTGIGSLIVTGSQFEVKSSGVTAENMIVAVENSGVTLYHDNIERIATSAAGANVSGTFATSGLATLESASVTNALIVSGTTTLSANVSITQNAVITGDLTVNGTTTLASNVELAVESSTAVTSNVTGLLNVSGNTVIGAGASNYITLNGTINTDIIPNTDSTYNIGSTTKKYNTIHATTLTGALPYANITGKPSFDNYQSWTIQDGAVNTYTITSGDTLQIAEGTGIDSNFTADDVLTITNVDLGSAQNIFKNVAVSGQTTVVADTNNDTLTIAAAGIVVITTDALTDTITITAPGTDLAITAGTTLGPTITSSTGSNSTIPSASGTASGIVNTTTQTFAGTKTFSNTISGNIDGNAATATTATTTTGNAGTATKLATARTIGGVSFDGSLAIDLPGVNTAGTQNTSGNAATATKLATARTINGVSFDGTANITVADSTKLPLAGGTMTGALAATSLDSTGGILELDTYIIDASVHSFNSSVFYSNAVHSFAGSVFCTTFNGNLTGDVSGNAATATKLAVARTINGVAFDGTTDITLAGSSNANTVTTISSSTAATHFLTFVADNNTSATAETLYTDAGISYNPSTNALTVSGDITTSSDARLKENVVTIDSALNKVDQMRGVYFNKIGKDVRNVGVIAQEMEEVLPEVVATDDEGMKSVAYANIVGVLIEAIKELKCQIDELNLKLESKTSGVNK
jgi:hypothetical protein